MIIFISAIIVAIFASFFCNLMEACLLSLSQTDIARIAQTRPRVAEIWRIFKTNIQKPIAVILIINTFALTIGAAISGAQFDKLFGSRWLPLYSVLFSVFMIQWTEILPKTVGVRFNHRIAAIIAAPLLFLVKVFQPVVSIIEFINKPFSRPRTGTESVASDITVLAHSAALQNQISREQESLISRSIQMSTLIANDVMVERGDIQFLSTAMTLSEGLIAAHLHRHTRFLLAENGDIDSIVGYVNFKDIVGALHMNPSDPSLSGIKRPVLFVDEMMKLPDLLRKLTRGYQHMAVIQNSARKTVGLITLEDIVETIVGELEDEYDVPPELTVQLSENRYRVGGGNKLDDLHRRGFPELPEENITVNDWVKIKTGGTPREQHSFTYNNLSFRVRRITRGNVYDIIVERK